MNVQQEVYLQMVDTVFLRCFSLPSKESRISLARVGGFEDLGVLLVVYTACIPGICCLRLGDICNPYHRVPEPE